MNNVHMKVSANVSARVVVNAIAQCKKRDQKASGIAVGDRDIGRQAREETGKRKFLYASTK